MDIYKKKYSRLPLYSSFSLRTELKISLKIFSGIIPEISNKILKVFKNSQKKNLRVIVMKVQEVFLSGNNDEIRCQIYNNN